MISLKDLQLLAETEYSVEETRQNLNEIIVFFQNRSWHNEAIEVAFVKCRNLPRILADENNLFFIEEGFQIHELPGEFLPEALGMVRNNYLVYRGRLIYPIKDTFGNAMGFCGWDKYEQPKYLDSKNHGYKAKYTTLYGMEKLEEYYRSKKAVYVTEGIVCCLYLRSKGLQSLALLGSQISSYVKEILKRFRNRLILLPDNDTVGKSKLEVEYATAGEQLVKKAKRMLPEAVVIQSTIAKDVDDTRSLQSGEYESLFLKELNLVSANPYLRYHTICVR